MRVEYDPKADGHTSRIYDTSTARWLFRKRRRSPFCLLLFGSEALEPHLAHDAWTTARALRSETSRISELHPYLVSILKTLLRRSSHRTDTGTAPIAAASRTPMGFSRTSGERQRLTKEIKNQKERKATKHPIRSIRSSRLMFFVYERRRSRIGPSLEMCSS